MPPRRELLPASRRYYAEILKRAFGLKTVAQWSSEPLPESLLSWPDSQKSVLRGAIGHATAHMRTFDVKAFLWDFGGSRYRSKRAHVPGEADTLKYEAAANTLPLGKRALALLPLALGFRAAELVGLTRATAEHAVASGEIIIYGKGDKERSLDCGGAIALFAQLLVSPATDGRPWKEAGDILSPGTAESKYSALYVLIRNTGKAAGITKFRPHLLRHAFATRLMRDGASLSVIQYALGHSSPTTTSVYVHPDRADLADKLRRF